MSRMTWNRVALTIALLFVGSFVYGLIAAHRWVEEETVPASELAAAQALRASVFPAEAECQARAVIDVNHDGIGEFAYTTELSGLVPVGATGATGAAVTLYLLAPTYRAAIPEITEYAFTIYLPDGLHGALSDPYPRASSRGAEGAVLRQTHWVAYAWPVSGRGHRMFAITEAGQVYVHRLPKRGRAEQPAWNALFIRDVRPGGEVPVAGSWDGPVSTDWDCYYRRQN